VLQRLEDSVDVFTDAREEDLEERAPSGVLVMSGKTPIAWTA